MAERFAREPPERKREQPAMTPMPAGSTRFLAMKGSLKN